MSTNIKSIHSSAINNVRRLSEKVADFSHFKLDEPAAATQDPATAENAVVMKEASNMQDAHFEKIETVKPIAIPNVKTVSIAKSIMGNLTRGMKINLWFVLALLVVRHFVPEIAEEISAVYEFLDTVVLPIVNWLYTVSLKVVNQFIHEGWVAKLLEILRNLAA